MTTKTDRPTEHEKTPCTYVGMGAQKARFSKPPRERNIWYIYYKCDICGKTTRALSNASRNYRTSCNGKKFIREKISQ